MRVVDVVTLIRRYTNTDSTDFSDADLTVYLTSAIEKFGVDIANVPSSTFFHVTENINLVADQRSYTPTTTNIVKWKKVEAMFDGTNWIPLLPLDIGVYGKPIDETTITSQFNNEEGNCFYEVTRNNIYIYSGDIGAVTNGLKLRFITRPAVPSSLSATDDLSVNASSTSHGMPVEFHELLARYVSMQWKMSRDESIPLSPLERSFGGDYTNALRSIANYIADDVVIAGVPSGLARGNDGFNY